MPRLATDPLEDFATHLREREKSPLSIETYLRDVRAFGRWFEETNGETLRPDRVTTTDLRDYKRYLRVSRRLQPNTVNRQLSSLQAFVRWSHDSGLLRGETTPALPRRVRQTRLGPRWLDHRERRAFLRTVQKEGHRRDIAIVQVLMHTGLRVAELCALEWRDISISSRKGRLVVRHGKGGRQREVPLNKEARAALQELGYPLEAGRPKAVFMGQRGPLSSRGVQALMKRYAERVRLDVSPQVLRHTFCKSLIDAGASLQEVASLAGHESLETTRRYCEPSRVDLQRVVDRLTDDDT